MKSANQLTITGYSTALFSTLYFVEAIEVMRKKHGMTNPIRVVLPGQVARDILSGS